MYKGEPQRAEFDRLMQEINLLKLEGYLFCYDPREARRRRGTITLEDALKEPVTIKIDAEYGQPSVLAYRVAQATFLKLANEGCTLGEDGRCTFSPDVVFSWRELAAMTGRSWGGKTSEELFRAVMQLRYTFVRARLFDKDTGVWTLGPDFSVFDRTYFTGQEKTITRAAFRVAPEIIQSMNRWHVAFFNLDRMRDLDTIGLVIAKRIFFHFSNLVKKDDVAHFKRTGGWPAHLKLRKDYETICKEWLGGLKPLRHKSQIDRDQLGPHLKKIEQSVLVRRYSIDKNAAGTGFNIEVLPGRGFFEDYEALYIDRKKLLSVEQTADFREIKSLELMAHFHRLMGRDKHNKFEAHEAAYALDLLSTWNEAEVRDLIEYSIEKAKKTGFEMLFFNGLKKYAETWSADTARRKARAKKEEELKSCSFCGGDGFLRLISEDDGRLVGRPCPHRQDKINQMEKALRASRVGL